MIEHSLARVKVHGLPVVRDGLLQIPFPPPYLSQFVVHTGTGGVEGQGFLVLDNGRLQLPPARIGVAQIVVCFGIGGVEGQY